VNRNNEEKCSNCGFGMDWIFKYTTQEVLQPLLDEYNKEQAKAREIQQEQDRIERERVEKEKEAERIAKEKAKKKNTIIGIIVGIVACVLIGLIIDSSIIAGRETYDSESAMRTALQGTYIRRFFDRPFQGVVIEGDKMFWYSYSDGDARESDITWHPSRGYITTRRTDRTSSTGGTISGSSEDRTFIIKRDGNRIFLLDDDREWRSGSLSSLGLDPTTDSYKENVRRATAEAERYIRVLVNMHDSITRIVINGDADVSSSGNYFTFDCTVHLNVSPRWRDGTITVRKTDSGGFEAQELKYR
jgi:hypothetical protein